MLIAPPEVGFAIWLGDEQSRKIMLEDCRLYWMDMNSNILLREAREKHSEKVLLTLEQLKSHIDMSIPIGIPHGNLSKLDDSAYQPHPDFFRRLFREEIYVKKNKFYLTFPTGNCRLRAFVDHGLNRVLVGITAADELWEEFENESGCVRELNKKRFAIDGIPPPYPKP